MLFYDKLLVAGIFQVCNKALALRLIEYKVLQGYLEFQMDPKP